ncbi:AREL1 [Acanthosepion pharaonis]|uniref:AREL1 n=1 Tax=Acanthosepion pharaonis TaxID=158019 RepID=A0A812AR84_ACAPH|nr:AREL1 [Sepia pharaonis]
MNYSSTVVCTVGTSHPLTIETRDMFGNLTPYKADQQNYFKIRVRETGSNARHVPATQIFYDPASRRLTMHIRMEKEGSFQATVTYGDVKLKNGEFNILVLSCDDTARVKKNLAKRSHDIWYEARLISCNHEHLEKPKKVYVYMSPKTPVTCPLLVNFFSLPILITTLNHGCQEQCFLLWDNYCSYLSVIKFSAGLAS